MRFTQFCSASAVCSPARAALLTGRYPARAGVPGVLDPSSPNGLPESEATIASSLKAAGYRTGYVGKWHLGHRAPFLPTARGFDEYMGIPYSHDMWPRPLMRGRGVVEETANLETLTERFTLESEAFIRSSQASPFFLFLGHTAPHIPLAPSRAFRGRTRFGDYGDSMAEFDASVGRVMASLDQAGVANSTLVLLTSDNGPWFQGSAGNLRGRKAETWEGGLRVPMIARMPGRIKAGAVNHGFFCGLDIAPTIASLTGTALPGLVDGVDASPLLTGQNEELDRDVVLFLDFIHLQCARLGRWKLHLARFNSRADSAVPGTGRKNLPLPKPELYDVVDDPLESYDCSDRFPEVVEKIRSRAMELLREQPEYVQDAWRETSQRQVEWTPAGSTPVERR
jgi:arylsulfatase A-like enzyme